MRIGGFAALYGVVFVLVGLAGFVPGLSPEHAHPGVTVTTASRLVFGLFPVNVLHNLVHILFGLWGLLAARSVVGARFYGRAVAVIYGVLTVAGLIPGLDTLFGLVPLFGNDVWLHALLAAVAAYFGFVHRDRVADRK